jgi:hypothetical protein
MEEWSANTKLKENAKDIGDSLNVGTTQGFP